MISSVSTLSTSAIRLLFGQEKAQEKAAQLSGATPGLSASSNSAAGRDDVFKAGNAIGKIIEIVAKMNTGSQPFSGGTFSMEGANRVDGSNGEYNLVKSGTGTVGSESETLSATLEASKGAGPEAEAAKAYLKAVGEGKVQKFDMSTMGVSSVMTKTEHHYADGGLKGESFSWNTTGMDAFLEKYTISGEDGLLRDKATGKYAGINQNGTQFTYVIY